MAGRRHEGLHVVQGITIGLISEVAPAALLEEQAGPKLCQRTVSALVGFPCASLGRTPVRVAVEGERKPGDLFAAGVIRRGVAHPQVLIWNFSHGHLAITVGASGAVRWEVPFTTGPAPIKRIPQDVSHRAGMPLTPVLGTYLPIVQRVSDLPE